MHDLYTIPISRELLRALPIAAALVGVAACSGGGEDRTAPLGDVDTGATDPSSEAGGGESDTIDEDGTGPGLLPCPYDCGPGSCIEFGPEEFYCVCPDDTDWRFDSCEPCPVIAAQNHDIHVRYVDLSGEFLVAGAAPPANEYDDAQVWLENARTNDRVLLGNTHDLSFQVRVTPGFYEIVYEVETPGAVLPHNSRVVLDVVPVFHDRYQDVEIPVARVSGDILLDGGSPPTLEYDDANIFLRDLDTGGEILVGNTHDGDYQANVVPGDYEIVYRVETPGQMTPRNDGAVLELITVPAGQSQHDVEITSVPLQGEFMINGVMAPASEYDDANILLESSTAGTVVLGNTHDQTYDVNVIPGNYSVVYMHETGASVPQNHRAAFDSVLADGFGPVAIDVPMVTLSGMLTVNGGNPPMTEFDDGILHLIGQGDDDLVPLGNTHDGAYQVNLIPGTYDVYYSQETAGGTVPENKRARVASSVSVLANDTLDVDIPAVSISGTLTLDGAAPPSSAYEDGRLYLRNASTEDSLLLGSTYGGSYSAVVVPGDYELFYTQEAGGEVPSNKNASLGPVSIVSAMTLDLDVPVVDLAGQFLVDNQPAPSSAGDGGQLYLRAIGSDDSVLLGSSFETSYATKLVAGTYGVYYRSAASVTMPENENGRFACITVE